MPDELTLADLNTPQELADHLGFTVPKLYAYLKYGQGGAHYHIWQIRKKSGGTRTIASPQQPLLGMQQRLASLIAASYTPRKSAHGYVTGHSIVTNAQAHVGRTWVLNLDLEDFFPSITYNRIVRLLESRPFHRPRPVAEMIGQICCLRYALPIGAPTSPVLSNAVCFGLDGALMRLARETRSWYTRFADDITFSTDRPELSNRLAVIRPSGVELGEELTSLIVASGFTVNDSKTRVADRHSRLSVTGLTVNRAVNVRREFVREIRAMLHARAKYGKEGAQSHLNQRYSRERRWPNYEPGEGPDFDSVLRGKLAFLSMVRGDNDPVVRKYMNQFQNVIAGRDLHDNSAEFDRDTEARLLVLSDFHFRTKKEWDARKMRQALQAAVVQLSPPPDAVLVTGDIAFSGKPEEYELAEAFFRSLLKELSLAPDRLFLVPGNHDVDRSLVRPSTRDRIAALQSKDTVQLADEIQESLEREPGIFTERLSAYLQFAASVTGIPRELPWWNLTVRVRDLTLKIAGLNSALLSVGDHEKGRLAVGLPLVNELPMVGADEVSVALLHHPFDYLLDAESRTANSVRNWADVVVHGHLHEATAHAIQASANNTVMLAAGACYQGSAYPNSALIVDVDGAARTSRTRQLKWIERRGEWNVSSDEFEAEGTPQALQVRPST